MEQLAGNMSTKMATKRQHGGLLGGSWEHSGASAEVGFRKAKISYVRVRLRCVLEASWGHLGAVLGPSWAILGLSWSVLGPSWGRLVVVLGHLGVILGCLGGVLGPSWDHLGAKVDMI